MNKGIYFWQITASPHMIYLAEELAALGMSVTYVFNDEISGSRVSMGWKKPSTSLLNLIKAPDRNTVKDIVERSPVRSIHICQGIRANKLVNFAQTQLSKRGISYWVTIETIEEVYAFCLIKRLVYSLLLRYRSRSLMGILSIGWTTRAWLTKRGFDEAKIFPFAYFLSDNISLAVATPRPDSHYKIIFVGQLIGRKCIHHLIRALSLCPNQKYTLTVVGDGILRASLEKYASELIPGKVDWLGNINMHDIPSYISNSDCLVLPSRHDGWGAVVSEALMVGTPVICSDACGSAEVVSASGFGGVFPVKNVQRLSVVLNSMISDGPIDFHERESLREWARFLGAKYGASYLMSILASALFMDFLL